MAEVKIDDASAFLARFANGSLATFEATRYASGHKALFTIEVNGEHGSLAWDLSELNQLRWFDRRDEAATSGWRTIPVTNGTHPYMKPWWAHGLQIGYEHSFVHQVADFLEGLATGRPAAPTFRDGWATDLMVDAVLRSARSGRWERPGPAIEVEAAANEASD
jgi:predicted dehydrogenase|nr:Gfo/Idh/MocA family oxidoreductase [Opitutus sp. GAS368]